MTSPLSLPHYPNFTSISISNEGLSHLRQLAQKRQHPGQHAVWTDDYRVELPIRLAKEGVASLTPTTVVDEWKVALERFGKQPAMSVKRNNQWVTLTYEQLYSECLKFSRALLALGYAQFTVVNLIGFNSPQWVIAYFGSMLARCIPVGIYATNSQTACHYIASHSECRIIIAENYQYAEKYYQLLGKGIDKIVIYGEAIKDNKEGRVVAWAQFIALGAKDAKDSKGEELQQRMKKIQPGNCATLIYTSGTTGMPKGVMLSHDNFIFACKSTLATTKQADKSMRIVSYLPLSHAAGQFIDIFMALLSGHHIFFADPSALTGSLIQTLQQIKPQAFFSVPRVWEKIYDKMMEVAKANTGILAKIGTWAKSIGEEGTMKEERGEETSLQFKIAKKLVYNRVKQALGLDQCGFFIFGSAPLDPAIRKYFFSLNIFLRNGYGMTECTAPSCSTDPHELALKKVEDYLQVGVAFPGTQTKIAKLSQKDEQGEICMRGRNICMGYFKNAEDTAKTIDGEGFLHSGDVGKIKQGVLFITGRVKQLIITAGGENIPPILIENQIKAALPCLANVMAIGDHRKFLTCLISLKEDPPQSGTLDKTAADFLASKGCPIKTVKEAANNQSFQKIIRQGLASANSKAISRAQYVQDFHLMQQDFSIENGMLTPTLKLKRRQAMKKYEAVIEAMYTKPKL